MQKLLAALQCEGARPVFLTGAGISIASGIPTFRGSDPGAVWETSITEMGTNSYFLRHPEKSWAWYLERFGCHHAAKPNTAHEALVALEARFPETRVVTQNVDGLHYKAGQKNLVEVHGSVRKMRCTNKHCEFGAPRGFLDWDDSRFEPLRAEVSRKNMPRCPKCRKFLRAHVLWFDESYESHKDYHMDRVSEWFGQMTALICVGTSFSVNITTLALMFAGLDKPVFVIDPHANPVDASHHLIKEPAEEFLPRLVTALAQGE